MRQCWVHQIHAMLVVSTECRDGWIFPHFQSQCLPIQTQLRIHITWVCLLRHYSLGPTSESKDRVINTPDNLADWQICCNLTRCIPFTEGQSQHRSSVSLTCRVWTSPVGRSTFKLRSLSICASRIQLSAAIVTSVTSPIPGHINRQITVSIIPLWRQMKKRHSVVPTNLSRVTDSKQREFDCA